MTRPAAALGGKAIQNQHQFRECDCVELYLPKRLSYLSRLYQYLNELLKKRPRNRAGAISVDGFSIYEVDGAWRDEQREQEADPVDERTLVIRVLLNRTEQGTDDALEAKIMELARDIEAIAPNEAAILISYYKAKSYTLLPDRGRGK